ncbi:MAG: OmpA family protein [Pseudomonadota bacterium]
MRNTLSHRSSDTARRAAPSSSSTAYSAAAAAAAPKKLDLRLFAGLMAALGLLGAGVAHQHFSREAAPQGASAERVGAVATATVDASDALREGEGEAQGAALFAAQLRSGYLNLAMDAYERQAFRVADFFAQRSIWSGAETPPAPLAPDFDTPAEAAVARRALMARLAAGDAARDPETAARAQLAVDCWLREAEADGERAVQRRCRDEARAAMAALEGGAAVGRLVAERLERDGDGAAPDLTRLMSEAGAALEPVTRPIAAAWRRQITAAETAPGAASTEGALKAGQDNERSALEQAALAAERSAAETTAQISAFTAPAERPIARTLETATIAAAPDLPTVAVSFGFDSVTITPEARAAILARFAEAAERPVRRIRIEGHTDASGPAAYNQALSERRAEAVAAVVRRVMADRAAEAAADLQTANFAPGVIRPLSIEVIGFGETRLSHPTADGVRDARNRRVEIHFR